MLYLSLVRNGSFHSVHIGHVWAGDETSLHFKTAAERDAKAARSIKLASPAALLPGEWPA